jgi:polyprenyl-phospho-N-acetylgalactosaminyl synthase
MDKTPEICVIIPAYNESQVLGEVLDTFKPFPYLIIVVNDGSTDDTAQKALQYPVTLLNHLINLGQGAALQTGIDYALSLPSTRYIATFDADGQHFVEDIEKLLCPLRDGTAEAALGSRFLNKERNAYIPFPRRVFLYLALIFTRLTTGLKITDTHNGMRAFTRKAATEIRISINRMAHASDILSQIATRKLSYVEIPVRVTYTAYSRAKGQSFLNAINILWDLFIGKVR